MSNKKINLAKVHSLLGGGNEEIFQEIMLLDEIPDLKSKEEAIDFIFAFSLTKKERENILLRVSKIDFSKTQEYISRNNINIITVFDSEYPNSLRNIYDPPKILYLKGKLKENFRIAVVGPRNPSTYAREITRKIVKSLSENNICIVSGMAAGIDRIAHEESYQFKAGSIGILGSGIDIVYPRDNFDLFARMNNFSQNVLISEFPIGFPPAKYTFPKRNRIISGLSQGVLITEGSKKSGSMITARHAYEQGKSVYALPGLVSNPLTEGVHQLIKDGASLVETAGDILEDLYPMLKIQANNKKFLNLTEIELNIVKNLQINPESIEGIMSLTGKSVTETLRIVSLLEIKGVIKKEINNKYLVII